MIKGNFLAEMVNAVRRDGVGALYWGFFAFCMESFPYDIMELVRCRLRLSFGPACLFCC